MEALGQASVTECHRVPRLARETAGTSPEEQSWTSVGTCKVSKPCSETVSSRMAGLGQAGWGREPPSPFQKAEMTSSVTGQSAQCGTRSSSSLRGPAHPNIGRDAEPLPCDLVGKAGEAPGCSQNPLDATPFSRHVWHAAS